MSFNARSVATKQAELSCFIDQHNSDIVAIVETWLNDSVKFCAFDNSYNVYRQDRINGRGGGVLLAIKSNLQSKFVDSFSVGGSECVFVDVLVDSSNYIRYGVVYRPPDRNYGDSLLLYNEILKRVENVKYYTLLGDFNIPDINWSEITAQSVIAREFLTFCLKLGAHQCVAFPTRQDHILDLVLCSDTNLLKSIRASEPFSTSDHNAILCSMYSFERIERANVQKPCFQKADFNLINAFLATIDWNVVYENCNSTEEHWSAFKNIIDTVIVNFVPFVNVSKRHNKPWFNGKLHRLCLIKQRRWRTYFRNSNIVTYADYKAASQKFRSEFLSSKCQYEQKIFGENNDVDSKRFHNYVKRNTTIASSIPCMKKDNGSLATSDYEKACLFSDYFSSVFTQDDNILPDFNPNCNSNLNSFNCSVRDVIKTIRRLKNNSAPGIDNYTPFFLKQILAHIASPLTKLFNVSLEEGIVPQDWKTAIITPIFKKGDSQLASQYRPVSLTSVVCKVLERIIREQLVKYLVDNNIIPMQQHGFLSKKSTTTNLLECLDKWTKNFDSGIQTDILYLDYSKCFDTVCHSKLLHKLSKYGVDGPALHWIQSFLNNRIQYVKINSTLSEPASVTSGVPQGSVLGPVLFLCFSADLKNVVKYSEISIYADDTKLFKGIENKLDCHLLQQDLDAISQWANIWQLRLNPDKTKRLTIGKIRYDYDYVLDDKVIENVEFMCDLGIIVQSNLKYTRHCNNVKRKAYFSIRNLFNTFKNHDCRFYANLYICYVRPLLESASQIWSPIQKGNIDGIESVQRYFTRRLPDLKDIPYLDRLKLLKLETLEARRIKSDLVLFYKMLLGKTDIHVNSSYQFVHSYRGHNKTLFLHYSRTDKRNFFWINRIVHHWNNLSYDIVNANTISNFKAKLQSVNHIGRGSIYCA